VPHRRTGTIAEPVGGGVALTKNSEARDFDVADPTRQDEGRGRIAWAAREMPVLELIGQRFAGQRPLQGVVVGACLHVTTETARLVEVLHAGGARVRLCASNPLTTQDDVAAALVSEGIPVFARRGENSEQYYDHIHQVLREPPAITMDDGADLITTLHQDRTDLLPGLKGGTEETTTGVMRLRAMAGEGALQYPVVAVNDAMTKHFFDNRYGTGQSTMDGLLRATNTLIAGKVFVVAGYGWCSRGIAMRAKGEGANVVVTEVDALRALEAAMDGYRVLPMIAAAEVGDIFVTATGDLNVIDRAHLERMKDGAILANSGHFNVEINLQALESLAVRSFQPRQHVTTYVLEDGRQLHLLAEGRLVNLAAAEGHPSAVMDMSFANQALCVEYLVKHDSLSSQVHPVPTDIDQSVASLKLQAMGLQIDTLTPEQQAYCTSWQSGT
jgi:adenosylhomocysteinase